MGLAILHCRAQIGVDAPPVTIEIFLSGGISGGTKCVLTRESGGSAGQT